MLTNTKLAKLGEEMKIKILPQRTLISFYTVFLHNVEKHKVRKAG
jgi:hypothetical protein